MDCAFARIREKVFDGADDKMAVLFKIKLESTFSIHRFYPIKERIKIRRRFFIMFVQNGIALIRPYVMLCRLKWAESETKFGGATRCTFCTDCRRNIKRRDGRDENRGVTRKTREMGDTRNME